MSLADFFAGGREARIKRAELELADAKHYLSLWGNHFGKSPSEREQMESDVRKAQAKLDSLRSSAASGGDGGA